MLSVGRQAVVRLGGAVERTPEYQKLGRNWGTSMLVQAFQLPATLAKTDVSTNRFRSRTGLRGGSGSGRLLACAPVLEALHHDEECRHEQNGKAG